MQPDDIRKYCDLMEEVKRRMSVINSFGAGVSGAFYRATTIECVYLQFRKILELIAFGSLVANKHFYSQVYANFALKWNARKLLGEIEALNPDFYPQPIEEQPSALPDAKIQWIHKTQGFLTRDDFVTLYQACGKILHSENPYGSIIDYGYYEKNIQQWIKKIIALTNTHLIRLVNDPNLYLIHMKGQQDDLVHHYVFAPVPPPA